MIGIDNLMFCDLFFLNLLLYEEEIIFMNFNLIFFGNIIVSNVMSLILVVELVLSFRNDCGVGFSFFICEDNFDFK